MGQNTIKRQPKIGFTERGDAGRDLSWLPKLMGKKVDGAVLVTKIITDEFIDAAIRAMDALRHEDGTVPIIVHCTVTGWGGTAIEPCVPEYALQIDQLERLVRMGFPADNCVIRIDPIWPTENGLKRAQDVVRYAHDKVPQVNRYRVSLLDEYRHVKQRFRDAGFAPIYGEAFGPDHGMVQNAALALRNAWPDPYRKCEYECCAEKDLAQYPGFKACGCLSDNDMRIMGIQYDPDTGINGQNRNGCMCLRCKIELLENRRQCPNKCMYCYWRDDAR